MPDPKNPFIEFIRVGVFGGAIAVAYILAIRWIAEHKRGTPATTRFAKFFRLRVVGAVLLGTAVLGVFCIAYGFFIEPKRLTVTRYRIETPKIPAGETVRIVHLSDMHIRERGRRERLLPELVRSLKPDVILHTGDFFARTPVASDVTAEVLASWDDIPQFACMGNLDPLGDYEGVLAKAHVAEPDLMHGIPLTVRRAKLRIFGAPSGSLFVQRKMGHLTGDAYNILLYHHPSGFPTAWDCPIDLMLAGHIHGGQVRLPFYGALITLDRYGKRYEYGRFDEHGATLIVSRGIGCEPNVPEVRFLCLPEVVFIELVGTGT